MTKKELEKEFKKYLKTLQSKEKDEIYGTEKDIAEEYITSFILYLFGKEKLWLEK